MATEVEASSLDDFFAKKDKSKKKKTKVVLSEVNTISQSEEKPKKKKSKEKSSASSEGVKNASASSSSTDNKGDNELQAPTDEWVEIEEKADADYSGLKIQSLRLEEREAAAKEENGGGEDDEDGKNGSGNDGPWKKVEVAPVVEKDNTTEVVSESKESTPTGTGKYVPPSVKAAQRQAAQQSSAPMRKRNNKLAPDVNDQETFPTLGGVGGGGGGGVSVGVGGRRTPGPGDSPADAPKSYTSLHLQNKWDSLSRGSSES